MANAREVHHIRPTDAPCLLVRHETSPDAIPRSVQSVVKQTENKPDRHVCLFVCLFVLYDKFSLHERSDNSVVTVGMGEFRNDQLDFCCN